MLWRIDDPKRFIEQIRWTCEEENENGCWIWPSCLEWNGRDRRPTIKIHNKTMNASRWVLWAITGELQDVARHTCDVGCCCNPDHLIWGTHADNGRDKVIRGRSTFGEKNGSSKLTEDQVREIKQSNDTHISLSKKFGVNEDSIWKIKKGINWKHIT